MATLGFDTLGSVLIFSGVGTGIAALSMGKERGWTSGPILLLLLSLLINSAFLFREWYQPSPLDLHLLKQPQFTMGIGTAFINRMVVSGTVFLLPLYSELVKGYTANFAGLLLVVSSLLIIVFGPVAGTLSDRIGSRWLCTLAGILLLFVIFDSSMPLILILIALGLRALSMGFFSPPNLRLVLSFSQKDHQGSASALWYFSRYLGAPLGSWSLRFSSITGSGSLRNPGPPVRSISIRWPARC